MKLIIFMPNKEKNPFEVSDWIENLEDNTFIREARDGTAISK